MSSIGLRKKTFLWFGAGLLIVLITIRLALPPIILRQLNEHLKNFSPDYSMHIDSLELSFLRMAYRFNNLEAKFNHDGHKFFNIESVDVSIAWRELLHGRVLTDVVADSAKFFLTKQLINGSKEAHAKPKEDASKVADKLFPLRISRIELHRSNFEFADLIGQPEVTRWRLTNIEGHILNLTPTPHNALTFFTLAGNILDSARVKIAGKLKRLDKPMGWKIDIELRDFDLVAANPMLLRLVPLTFTSGHVDMFSEVRSVNGKVQGYVKPFFKKVKVISAKEHFVGIKHFAIEVVAALANWILRRSDDKTVAAKIPFHNEGAELKVDNAEALQTAIEHGFQEPIAPELEDSLVFN